MDDIKKLEEIFSRFPGIGPRQARRFVYHILGKSVSSVRELSGLLEKVKSSMNECERCHRFFAISNRAARPVCGICGDNSRDKTILMVVGRDMDLESIEKSGVYKGYYFILGGLVPILDKEPDKRIRLEGLLKRIAAEDGLKEIILSLNATPEGEHTAHIVREAVYALTTKGKIRITVLGRGLSTGAELEYVDSDTIKNALDNRR